MRSQGQISLSLHSAVEILAGPALMAAPLLIDFPVFAGLVSFALGALLIGLALAGHAGQGERGTIPLSAHAAFDRIIGVVAIVIGVALGLAGGFAAAAVFMAGFGIAHLALTAATRFTAPLGA
ncbi:MAG: hypothetical protein QOG09_1104 [Solirubrobacterales bacterium]|jgi:hypothetical protein|nr:hypothetical protein [Solirubrobacterales bacterium]MDX6652623.1 hypothetical protein [Solirubrobacterales bacterium]MDX6663002.1 hypothetical protein [Solirubrobacterales bacterium]